MTTDLNDHQPESWFWEAGSDDCPHGPEPKADSPEWDTWNDRHTGSPQDVRICRDAPAGEACGECSEDASEMVPWAACRIRPRIRRDGEPTPEQAAAHAPITVTGGDLACLERECDDFFDGAGEEIPGKTACSHMSEMEICDACTGEWKAGEFPIAVAWKDCSHRLVTAGTPRRGPAA